MAAPQATALKVGFQFAKYQLVRELGAGGFGKVYVGLDTTLGREIAVKFLLPEHSTSEELLQRFFQEAKAAASINHPGIVLVFECGRVAGTDTDAEGCAYIAMELLAGETLSARRRRQRILPSDFAVHVARQVASALGAAHAQGIIHRDLKPENIFLVPDTEVFHGERVKVLDFGIAKLSSSSASGGVVTQTVMVFGTPPYMSPEQCRSSARVDNRSDVYALGCILFEMVCGTAPFIGDMGEVLAKQQLAPPPLPRSLNPNIPPALEACILRALEKNPDARFQSMEELRTALKDIARNPSQELAAEALMSTMASGGMAAQSAQRPSSQPPAPGSQPNLTPVPVVGSQPNLTPQSQPYHTPQPGIPSQPNLTPPPTPAPQITPPPSTTMSGAAGSAPVLPTNPPRARSRLPLIIGVLVVLGGAAAAALLLLGKHTGGGGTGGNIVKPAVVTDAAPVRPVAVAPPDAAPAAIEPAGPNPWVRVDPPGSGHEVLLGVGSDDIVDSVPGLRPTRGVAAPKEPFAIQQHEVTWAELRDYYAKATKVDGFDPAVPGPDRDLYPATGIRFEVAQAYCQSLGGDLPSEEQWEYAARGPDRRPYPWGRDLPDLGKVNAFAGPDAKLTPVLTSPQDVTPGPAASAIHDLAGNAQEWVASKWREDKPGADEKWVDDGANVYGTLRGLPLTEPAPAKLPSEGAAWRATLCRAGKCVPDSKDYLANVGFRCVKPVK